MSLSGWHWYSKRTWVINLRDFAVIHSGKNCYNHIYRTIEYLRVNETYHVIFDNNDETLLENQSWVKGFHTTNVSCIVKASMTPWDPPLPDIPIFIVKNLVETPAVTFLTIQGKVKEIARIECGHSVRKAFDNLSRGLRNDSD